MAAVLPDRPAAGAPATSVGPGASVDGRYRLVRRLGVGGAGSVFEAEGPGGARVALKVVAAAGARAERIRARFAREVAALRRLSHPSIAAIRDAGTTADGLLYHAADLAPGRTLRACLVEAGGRLPARRALAIGVAVCDAIAHAHEHGVLHRDLKPENVLVEPRAGGTDAVTVVDFGLARWLDDEGAPGGEPALTRPGTAIGTPGYRAPEQAAGLAVDARADQYALAVVVHEALAGARPDEDGRPAPGLPPAVAGALARALAGRPEERFASVRDLAAALEAALADAGPEPAPMPAVVAAAASSSPPAAGRYVLDGPLPGAPGGAAFLAHHRETRRPVALRTIDVATLDEGTAERVRRDARLGLRFRHPAALALNDIDEADGLLHLAAEPPEGESLAARLARGEALAPGDAARTLDRVLDLLAAAHAEGLVHGALAAEDVFVSPEGRVKVAGLGLAPALARAGAFPAVEPAAGAADLAAVLALAARLLAPPPSPALADLLGRSAADFGSADDLRRALIEAAGVASVEPIAAALPALPTPATDACLAPQKAGRRLLRVTGAAGLTRLFLVGGRTLALGRSTGDTRRGIRNDVVLRVLPCRDATRDAANWGASLRLSHAHAAIEVDGDRATVLDRSSLGIRLDSVRIPRERPAPLPDAFALDLGAGALALAGRVHRSATGAVEAVVLHRPANARDHAYVLVVERAAIGWAPGAAIRIEGAGLAPLEAEVRFVDGAFEIAALAAAGRPLRVDGRPAAGAVALAPGLHVRLGDAEVVCEEVEDAAFLVP